MRIGGAYVGLGLGDSSDEIRRLKSHLRRKFGYATALADTGLFDQQMVDLIVEMQRRYNAAGQLATGKYTPGIVNAETKYVCGFLPRPPRADKRPLLFTVCGTGVPWWVGPDADTARALEGKYLWQPIGYPAQAVPMGPSITAGRDELVAQMERWRDRIIASGCAWAGYSQGALICSEAFMLDVRPANGRLHWALPHMRKAVMFGNPMRQKGCAVPDAGAPLAVTDHQGVTGTLMTDTPSWWLNYAHRADLYTDCPDDESGEDRTAIWQIIRNGNMISGPDSLLRQFMELAGVVQDGTQVAEATGMFKAMVDALMFFGAQTGPHINYSTTAAIDYLRAA